MHNTGTRVAAIVPCYNEGARVRPVLDTLLASPAITECIVVDDGSTDDLASIIKKDYPSVRFIRLEKNGGKGEAMDIAVHATDAEYLFFCDADLTHFTPEHVAAIVEPVTSEQYDMCIGLRSNVQQRLIRAIALNSGERCLHRSLWLRMPEWYKHGFRPESGLNMMLKAEGLRVGAKCLSYYQTLRERKHGLREGFTTRLILCYEVVHAWLTPLRARHQKVATHPITGSPPKSSR